MVRVGLVLLMLVAVGCEPYDVINVVNRADNRISVAIYRDTIPAFPSEERTEAFYVDVVNPGDSLRIIKMGKTGWSSTIYRSTNKKLNVFVYDIDSLDKYRSIDTLNRRRLYHRLEFSKQSLDSSKWTVDVQ